MSRQVFVDVPVYQDKECIACGDKFTTIENAEKCIKCRGSVWINGYLYPDAQLEYLNSGGFLVGYRNSIKYGRDGWYAVACLDGGTPDCINNLDMLAIRKVQDAIDFNSYFSIDFDGGCCPTPLFLFGRGFGEAKVLWDRFSVFADEDCGYIYGANHGLRNFNHVNYKCINKEKPWETKYEKLDVDYNKMSAFYD